MNRPTTFTVVVALSASLIAGALELTSAQAPGANVAQGTDGLGALLPPGGAKRS
jgi:hypothetical protein